MALVCLSLGGCTKQPPFPENQFREIAKRCQFTAVTYTPHYSFWSRYFTNAPLIDFSREPDPKAAHKCFNEQLIPVAMSIPDSASTHVWDTRE
jgi:hypothetical protein